MNKAVANLPNSILSDDVSTLAALTLKVTFGQIGDKGRGVICAVPIKKGETVEYVPAIPMPKSDIFTDSIAENYVLVWNEGLPDEQYCLVGGYVMLYNHSAKPNIAIAEDRPNKAFRVTALRDIEKGEEILWNYNCELWFDPKE